MTQPAWDNPELNAGVMIKGALWLIQDVGVGGVFTKADIRAAFPNTAQADRRIRDLRDFGWVLHTRSDDASLLPEQTRFVSPGVEVWDARARRNGSPQKTISAKTREEVMSRDGYMCTVCGITGGEEYPDDASQTALLMVAKQPTRGSGDDSPGMLATICKRCRAGRVAARGTAETVLRSLNGLDPSDLDELTVWMRSGRRRSSRVDFAWGMYMNLSPDERYEVRMQFEPEESARAGQSKEPDDQHRP